MVFQPAVNCVEIVIRSECDGRDIVNVLHARFPVAYNQSAIDTLAAAVDATVGAQWLAEMPDDQTYMDTTVRGLTSIVDLISVNNTSSGVGTHGAVALPLNLAAVVTFRTGMTGRSARGRMYWGAIPVDQQVDGLSFVAAYGTAIVADVNNTGSAISGLGWAWGILSRIQNKVKLPAAILYPITTIAMRNSLFDHQDGRLGRGH